MENQASCHSNLDLKISFGCFPCCPQTQPRTISLLHFLMEHFWKFKITLTFSTTRSVYPSMVQRFSHTLRFHHVNSSRDINSTLLQSLPHFLMASFWEFNFALINVHHYFNNPVCLFFHACSVEGQSHSKVSSCNSSRGLISVLLQLGYNTHEASASQ